jgi:transcriptional pleiotropic regulator of transition state genes
VDTDKIILKKYLPACLFCGNAEELVNFNSKSICKECATAIKSLVGDTAAQADPESSDTV